MWGIIKDGGWFWHFVLRIAWLEADAFELGVLSYASAMSSTLSHLSPAFSPSPSQALLLFICPLILVFFFFALCPLVIFINHFHHATLQLKSLNCLQNEPNVSTSSSSLKFKPAFKPHLLLTSYYSNFTVCSLDFLQSTSTLSCLI